VDANQIILELMALELYFEEGRQRCYSLRKDLEQVSAPAPSGDNMAERQSNLAKVLNKRKKVFNKGGLSGSVSKFKKTI
jgi:hypothetical protein